MKQRFHGDRILADILKWYGWGLYDVTTPASRQEPLSWDEMEMLDLAHFYHVSHKYSLLPIPKAGDTIRKAFMESRDQHIFPVLKMPTVNPPPFELPGEKRGFHVDAQYPYLYNNFSCYFLNELWFREHQLRAFTSPYTFQYHPSQLTIPTGEVVDVFSQYFTLMQFTDSGVEFREPLSRFVD